MSIQSEIQSLAPSALLEFFTLDSTNLPGGDLLHFHAGTNGLLQPVVWQGVTYQPLPIKAEGFDVSSKGSMPRPKMTVANANGLFSAEVKSFNDFVGCKVTRKRTFLKYLDGVNFAIQRNLFTDSSNFTTWTLSNCARTSNAATAPDGTVTATKLSSTPSNSTHYIFRQTTQTIVPGQSISYSIHAKAGEFNATQVRFLQSGCFSAATHAITVDLNTGEVLSVRGTPTYKVEASTNGFWRITITATADATGAARACAFICQGVSNTFLGDNGISGIYVWGSQFEYGAPTDYQAVGAVWAPNPTADPNQFIPDDIWYVERKTNENRHVIDFELSSAFDLVGVQLPNRQIIQNSCPWVYRSAECGWTGGYYDANNAATTAANDKCGKTLAACRTRFTTSIVRFGGFPGAVRGTT